MKALGISLVLLGLAVAPAFAAEPAKTVDTSAGKVFADAKGMTLYTFDQDGKDVSNCYDKCAVNWPPFLAGKGAKAEGSWTLVKRKDGKEMWAYDGAPLYTFIKDKKPGDITGDGVGGVWHLAKSM
ncbi:hypothetical protein OSH11_23080 [Kaistia dalseonensis]|uniref:Lipoprotein with Yx(FWY)xxD motif n=1 Tax=Kaistia dalseonensis TaxID=410840 RepID=A0ABU0HD46_9HYPH|nr:hypothetical protein [Kaistia dalseonensis]MCX5497600.1 hypothetical protein [Kaistia dalseonensis]MDQ0440242.1 putative lipoprotein with Yx(FWY)xxD motif [Kaistia dalseonensis]